MIILLDCDGVLADFVGAALDVAHEYTSLRFTREQLTGFEIFDHMVDPLRPTLKADIHKRIRRKGFCAGIRPIVEAHAAVENLRKRARVKVVTAPWKQSPTWCFERYEWLEEHFGFDHRDVIMTSDKSNVHGHILVDDKPENVRDWLIYQSLTNYHGYRGILWDTPHNRDSDLIYPLHRAHSWDAVHNALENIR